MSLNRVVITGMGSINPLGLNVKETYEKIIQNENNIQLIQKLDEIKNLKSKIASVISADIDTKVIERKLRRFMSRMSILATLSSMEALKDAFIKLEDIEKYDIGLIVGSTTGSIVDTQNFFEKFLKDKSMQGITSPLFFKIMSHSVANNIAQALGIKGRVFSLSSACSTSCQTIGMAYELIAFGKQKIILCGGAEEYHPLVTSTFDMLSAASVNFNNSPKKASRPFDKDRDGVVCAEGAGMLVLEDFECAKKRGVKILAEITGFATNFSTKNIAVPNLESIKSCMKKALQDAKIKNYNDIDYVNAHATSTIQGDIVESQAIHEVFGKSVKVSSLKGHLGHTMAANGAIELILTIKMMENNCIIPTLNLENVDENCADLNYIQTKCDAHIKTVIKNNFALGGINSSIVLRRYK